MLKSKACIYLLIACAIVLRLISLHYNRTLYGDVNNLALVAENVGKSFSSSLPYRTNQYVPDPEPLSPLYSEPYAQHQPLWMILGGLIYRAAKSADAFGILKSLSFIVGMTLLLLMAGAALGDSRFYLCFLLSCFSIALIDFSANGSFYILCSLLYFGFFLSILKSTRSSRALGWSVFAGLLGFMALLTHLIGLALIGSAALLCLRGRPSLRTAGLVSGGFMCAALLIYEVWKRSVFDMPPNPSMLSFFVRNGLAEETLDHQELRFVVAYGLSASSALIMLRNMLSGAMHFASSLIVLCGPLVIFLLTGVWRLIRLRSKAAFGICLSILAGHIAVVLLFPFNRFRFVIPVVPIVFFAVAVGMEAFLDRRDSRLLSRLPVTRYHIAVLALALFVGYNLFYLARDPHTFYDKSRAGTANAYDEMRETATWFRDNADPGAVLGYSRVLDGGVEAYYYHRHAFVAGRKFIPYPDVLPRLLDKYRIKYIWTEKEVWEANDRLRSFPVLHQQGRFLILSSAESPHNGG